MLVFINYLTAVFANSLPLDPILSQINPAHSNSTHTRWARSLNYEKRLLDPSCLYVRPSARMEQLSTLDRFS